jgi:hypothetical protein
MAAERHPIGTRVRVTERWPEHAGRVGTVVNDDGGEFSVYVRFDDDPTPTLAEWGPGEPLVVYSVTATRESVEVL